MTRFSIVTAVYNVERYLDEFIASVDAQASGKADAAVDFEVIAVDDGSTDRSREVLDAWAARASYPVTVVGKENGGQSTARNLGIEHARGEWITFTDPDDVLAPSYLAHVDTFLAANPTASMVACNLLMLDDATGEVTDKHPLRHRFRGTARLRDLGVQPAFFFASAPVAFFRRDVLVSTGLRFDPEIRPNFEDGHFTALYLLGFSESLVGFVPAAHYHYRKRSDASSTMVQSVADPGRYTTVLQRGYIDLLRQAAKLRDGSIPEWVQNLVLYELSWVIGAQLRGGSSSSAAVNAVAEEFHDLMKQLTDLLDPEFVEGAPANRLNQLMRTMILHSWSDADWHEEVGRLTTYDAAQGLVRIEYFYVGTAPAETVLSGGRPVEPVHAKIRDVELLGRVVLCHRILWVPAAGNVRVRLDDRGLRLVLRPVKRTTFTVTRQAIEQNLDRRGPTPEQPPAVAPVTLRARLVRRLARSRVVRRRFAGSWVLMDRLHDADDNGERLFEYLRSERPEINAWFTIRADSPAWRGLRGRHGSRVIAFGSWRWKLLVLNAEHLLSSHADDPIVAPPEIVKTLGVKPSWRFTFLQHGVIKDDLSGWLNRKPIDTFVTSTRAEHESIVADHTPYRYTTREARLTGLPRFDRLRALGAAVAPADRDLILVAPTWRNWLTAPMRSGSQKRSVHAGFATSEFLAQWRALLESEELAALAREHGRTLGFLPHPNLQDAMAQHAVPDHVTFLTFDGNDVQQLFARASVLVTDYSSMAFNAAYLERPVVYFQFDRDRVLSGEHVGKSGYFDYERDGFGPVTLDLAASIAAIREALTHPGPAPLYQARIEDTFPMRDGKCSERVTEVVLASARPLPGRAT